MKLTTFSATRDVLFGLPARARELGLEVFNDDHAHISPGGLLARADRRLRLESFEFSVCDGAPVADLFLVDAELVGKWRNDTRRWCATTTATRTC